MAEHQRRYRMTPLERLVADRVANDDGRRISFDDLKAEMGITQAEIDAEPDE